MPRYLLRSLFFVLVIAIVGLLTARAVAQSTAPPQTWRIADAPAQLKPAIAHADEVIVAQHSALLRQLNRELGEGGAAAAIKSCHLEATSQAFWVARQQGVAIGRRATGCGPP